MPITEKIADVSTNNHRLDFLYSQISMPRVCLAAWLRVPEFVEKISSLDADGILITDEVFLQVADPILKEKQLKRRDNQELRLPTLKRGLNHLQNGNPKEKL